MHPDDVRATIKRLERQCERTGEAAMRRGLVAERSDHPLAACPDQQWLTERMEQGQRVHQREIVRYGFAESDAGIKDEHGLFVCALTMAPNTRTVAPSPAVGDGQFVVVLKGSMVNNDRERNSYSVAFTRPDEPPLEILAGAQGLEALVLNLPQVDAPAIEHNAPSSDTRFKKWQCLLCSFAYDEALGLPEEGIAAGTRWADVPETWACPDCSASKGDFEMVEA